MGSFSGLGIGLSFVFGCILMGLVAELYYLLWWKKRNPFSSSSSSSSSRAAIEAQLSRFLLCFRKHPSTSSDNTNSGSSSMELTTSATVPHPDPDQDLEVGKVGEGEGIESELMRVHNLSGPPRFLFTIKEENREDLESEEGKSRKGSRASRSLSDLVFGLDGIGIGTPFLTPLSSPTIRPIHTSSNPLFETMSEAEMNRLRSSPPPKLKFLKDAEDKLIRRLLMEQERRRESAMSESDSDVVKVPPLPLPNN